MSDKQCSFNKISKEYRPSPTMIGELEEMWLASREGPSSFLQKHQCLTGLFEILKTDKPCPDRMLAEIGKPLGLSSYDVKERIREAETEGILSISARLAVTMAIKLQKKLAGLSSFQTSSLRVIVGEVTNRYSPEDKDRVDAAAAAAADYFLNVVPQSPRADEVDEADEKDEKDEKKPKPSSGWIGVSGGNTMREVVQVIEKSKPGSFEGLTVIPLAGEAEPEKFEISANSIVLGFARVCAPGKAKTRSLMTTPIVGPKTEQQLKDLETTLAISPSLNSVIDMAKKVKFAFTGIGGKEGALKRLRAHCQIVQNIPPEVVGDICYQPIDSLGEDAWPNLSLRLIGPRLADLKEMSKTPNFRRVFAVACGKEKVEPIIAAFRGRLVNGLITDELTALEILHRLEELEKPKRKKLRKKRWWKTTHS